MENTLVNIDLNGNEIIDAFLSKPEQNHSGYLYENWWNELVTNTLSPTKREWRQKLIHDKYNKANLLNKYFCSISSINNENSTFPNMQPGTESTISNIEQDVKDI